MELLTVDGMAKLLEVSPQSIYRWVRQRRVPFIKLEKHLRFDAQAVVDFFKSKTEEYAAPCFKSDLLLQDIVIGRRGHSSLKKSEIKAAESYPQKG